MDQNALLSAHQTALMRANAATDHEVCLHHLEEAAVIFEIISRLNETRREEHSASAPLSFIGRTSKPREAVIDWENEGGALDPHDFSYAMQNKFPPIIVSTSIEFSVGRYRYSNITDALSQQARMAGHSARRGPTRTLSKPREKQMHTFPTTLRNAP